MECAAWAGAVRCMSRCSLLEGAGEREQRQSLLALPCQRNVFGKKKEDKVSAECRRLYPLKQQTISTNLYFHHGSSNVSFLQSIHNGFGHGVGFLDGDGELGALENIVECRCREPLAASAMGGENIDDSGLIRLAAHGE